MSHLWSHGLRPPFVLNLGHAEQRIAVCAQLSSERARRPRGAVPAPGFVVCDQPAASIESQSPVQDLERFERTEEDEDDYRHRMLMNAIAAAVVILLIGGGIWIANTMALMRKNQDCALSGNRNCNPPVIIQTPKS